jgi:hypothetical protein
MRLRQIVALLAIVVAAPLVAAPITMADWSEQATFSAEEVLQSNIDEEVPVLPYTNLSTDAQAPVRRAIESQEGRYTVYGHDDWPEQFFYSDYGVPGQGLYAIIYDGQYYQLSTYAGGGFPFLYWFLELPFIGYGLCLGWAAHKTYHGTFSSWGAALVLALGVGFNLLGPAFDFPLVAPMQFVGLGVVGLVAVLGWIWASTRTASGTRNFSL